MSVIKCAERLDKRTASERDDGTRVYTRTYYVETDSKHDDAIVVLSYSGLPALFSQYQTSTTADLSAYCIGRDPQQIGAKNWDVVITNDSKQEAQDGGGGGGGGGNQQTDPEKWFSKVSFGFEKRTVPIPWTKEKPNNIYAPGDGVGQDLWYPVSNAAGEPYDPAPMRDSYYPIVTFSGFVKNFSAENAIKYIGALNQDLFWGAVPGTLQCTAYETSGMEYKKIGNVDVWYYPVKFEMRYDADGWDARQLNAGSYYVVGTTKKAFLTAEGQPYIGMLTSTGGKLADGSKAIFNITYKYTRLPFSSLGLPASMPLTP